MSYFLLPINNNIINDTDFYVKLSDDSNKTNYISHTLNEYLIKNKSKIEEVQQEWELDSLLPGSKKPEIIKDIYKIHRNL